MGVLLALHTLLRRALDGDVSKIFAPGPSNTGMPKLFPLEGQN